MNCKDCKGVEDYFDERYVNKVHEKYKRNGPHEMTQILIDGLLQQGVKGKMLLDIGGGTGGLQHALLNADLKSVVSVDASRDYIEVGKREARDQGHLDQIEYHYGDFVELAPQIPQADIVTLDKVICCYADMENLVKLSSAHSTQIYGLVCPIHNWWTRLLLAFENLWYWLKRSPFRAFVHPTQEVDALLSANGLKLVFHFQNSYWQAAIYSR